MTNTNTKATHSNQFENLKSLKSKTIPQIADFCQTLKQARQKLNDIDSAIQKKQNEFEEKFKAVEIAVQEEVVIENEKKETEKEVVSIEENIVKEVAPQVDAVDTVAVDENKPESETNKPKEKAKKNTAEPTEVTKAVAEDTTKENSEIKVEKVEEKTSETKNETVGDKSQEVQKDVSDKSVTPEKNVKTYTDDKGNIKVRRFISDIDSSKFAPPRAQSNVKNPRGDKNAQHRTPNGQSYQGQWGASGQKQNQGVRTAKPSLGAQSGKTSATQKTAPAFSTEFLPKAAPAKNYGNKNKTPEKTDDKQRNVVNKRQMLKRNYQIVDEDEEALLAKRPRSTKKQATAPQPTAVKVIDSAVITTKEIQIKTFSEKIGVPVAKIIAALFKEGIMKTINDTIEYDVAAFIAESFNVKLEYRAEKTAEERMIDFFDVQDEELADDEKRPPIVTVMGHVDHGKTSLLDKIRDTNVTAGEAGGITQHIGAYTVKIHGEMITFIDTPGHAAFTAMRARGAKVTDVAIIVVAADDGVMPQTVEAINHAKAADVSIIVAINKMDKPEANPDRVKQQLTEYGLVPEEWGGDTVMVPVSAKSGKNIDVLLESILVVTELRELKANSKKRATGTVIEAKLDKGRGPVATILIKNGTLSVGDSIIAGTKTGKIRAMFDDKGRKVKSAGPSYPVEVLGFEEVPDAGDIVHAGDEKNIKAVADERRAQEKEKNLTQKNKNVSLDDLFNRINEGELKTLNVIIKTDVQGSLEALKSSLEKLSNNEVRVTCIHGGVGAITENDVTLALSSKAIIIGFNVRPDVNAKTMAENAGVDIRLYRIIYDAMDDITKAMKGMLAPKFKEEILGQVTVRNVFKISGVGAVAGSYVNSGKITRNAKIRLYRNNVLITDCEIATLKRFKDDVKEVVAGFECGVSLVNYNDIKVDDVFEVYQMTQIEE